MTTISIPAHSGLAANLNAACNTAPDDMPAKIPSSRANRREQAKASSSLAAINSSTMPLPYGRYFLGSGIVADSACTTMLVTRQPPVSLTASMLLMPRATCLPSLCSP